MAKPQNKFASAASMINAMMMMAAFPDGNTAAPETELSKRVNERTEPKKRNPWDSINLSKGERKGKSYEELQELRKSKWVDLQSPDNLA